MLIHLLKSSSEEGEGEKLPPKLVECHAQPGWSLLTTVVLECGWYLRAELIVFHCWCLVLVLEGKY
jgi:hypothetical protein